VYASKKPLPNETSSEVEVPMQFREENQAHHTS